MKSAKQAEKTKLSLPPNPLQSELSPKSAKSPTQTSKLASAKGQASEDLLSQKNSLTQRVQALKAEVTHLEKDAKTSQKLAPLDQDDFEDLEREVKEVGCRNGVGGFG